MELKLEPCFEDFDVPAIGPGFHYDPPDIPGPCDCSTVTYSLLSKTLDSRVLRIINILLV
jgi:hypothetical protein